MRATTSTVSPTVSSDTVPESLPFSLPQFIACKSGWGEFCSEGGADCEILSATAVDGLFPFLVPWTCLLTVSIFNQIMDAGLSSSPVIVARMYWLLRIIPCVSCDLAQSLEKSGGWLAKILVLLPIPQHDCALHREESRVQVISLFPWPSEVAKQWSK